MRKTKYAVFFGLLLLITLSGCFKNFHTVAIVPGEYVTNTEHLQLIGLYDLGYESFRVIFEEVDKSKSDNSNVFKDLATVREVYYEINVWIKEKDMKEYSLEITSAQILYGMTNTLGIVTNDHVQGMDIDFAYMQSPRNSSIEIYNLSFITDWNQYKVQLKIVSN